MTGKLWLTQLLATGTVVHDLDEGCYSIPMLMVGSHAMLSWVCHRRKDGAVEVFEPITVIKPKLLDNFKILHVVDPNKFEVIDTTWNGAYYHMKAKIGSARLVCCFEFIGVFLIYTPVVYCVYKPESLDHLMFSRCFNWVCSIFVGREGCYSSLPKMFS